MLAVGTPLAAAPTTALTSTTPAFHAPLTNISLDVPQGDQAPVPPYPEGLPYRPDHWDWSTNRTVFMKNRFGKYLQMWPNGKTQGVSENNSFCVFVLLSHLKNLVIKGLVSERFLCMNSTTSRLYSRTDVHEDCYLQEAIRNGTGQCVYNFPNCQTPSGKKCYLGMFRNGTMRLGREARQSQFTAQWLPKPVNWQDRQLAIDRKETIRKGGWLQPTVPTPVTVPPVSKREQTRKRVRRWCRNLNLIVNNSPKFLKRCKHDCDVLKNMVGNPERYMRRCLFNHVRRRMRNKALKESGSGGPVVVDNAKVRARVQALWPKRDEVFQRLRQLRRCNQKRRQRKDGRKRGSCSKRDLRRQQRRRAEKRKKTARSLSSKHSSQPSRRSRSKSRTKSRSRDRFDSDSRRHRVRHARKKSGSQRRARTQSAKSESPLQDSSSSRTMLKVLTVR